MENTWGRQVLQSLKSKIIFVGLNPSRVKIQDARKLSTHDRFKKWLDFFEMDYACFTNLTGDQNWNFSITDIDLMWIAKQLENDSIIIALGKKTSIILSKLKITHFQLPHPSPRNRQLNSKEYEMQQLKECKTWIQSQI